MKFVLAPARNVRAGDVIRITARLRRGEERGYFLVEFCGMPDLHKLMGAAGLPEDFFWAPLAIAPATGDRFAIVSPETGLCHLGAPTARREIRAPVAGFYRVVQEGGPGLKRATITAKLRTRHGFVETFGRLLSGLSRLRRRHHAPQERD